MPQAVAFDIETGQPVPEEQAEAAIRSGKASFRQDQKVYLRDPATGRTVSAVGDAALSAMQNGYSVQPSDYVAEKERARAEREKYQSAGQTALAATEGLARGATLGLSDQIATAIDEEGVAKRMQYRPGVALGTELLGTVGSVVASGGTGALAKGAATGAKAAVAAEAATGARALLAGAKTAARYTPAALAARGAEAVGAKVAAKAGSGLLGRAASMAATGAIEGAAQGAGHEISRAALANEELTAEQLLAGAGEGALFGGAFGGALGAGTGLAAKGASKLSRMIGEGGAAGAAERLALRQVSGGNAKTYNAILDHGGSARAQRIGRRILDDGLLDNADDAARTIAAKVDDAGKRMAEVSAKLDESGARIDGTKLLERTQRRIDELKSGDGFGGHRKAAKKLEKELEPIMDRLTTPGRGDLSFEEAWAYRRKLAEVTKWDQSRPDIVNREYKRLYAEFSQSLDDAAESASPEILKQWKGAAADFSDYKILQDAVAQSAKKDLRASLTSGADTVLGGLGTSVGIASGIATGSFGLGALSGIAGGAVLSQVNKAIREKGAGWAAKALDRMTKASDTMDAGARLLVGQKLPQLARQTGISAREQYETARQDIAATSDPRVMQQRLASLTQGLEDQPQLATAIHTRYLGDVQYVRDKMPTVNVYGPGSSLTPDASEGVEPSADDVRKFASVTRALSDPTAVVSDLASGDYDPVAWQALKDRRPAIYQEMRRKIVEYAATAGKEIPYKQRVLLSLAFDFTADPSMKPENVAAIQGTFAPDNAAKPGPKSTNLSTKTAEAHKLPSEVP